MNEKLESTWDTRTLQNTVQRGHCFRGRMLGPKIPKVEAFDEFRHHVENRYGLKHQPAHPDERCLVRIVSLSQRIYI